MKYWYETIAVTKIVLRELFHRRRKLSCFTILTGDRWVTGTVWPRQAVPVNEI